MNNNHSSNESLMLHSYIKNSPNQILETNEENVNDEDEEL
jgi:hypothetical protein